ncbi:MAG: alpha/beta hydrolase, partial [Flavobacteriales bacterium]
MVKKLSSLSYKKEIIAFLFFVAASLVFNSCGSQAVAFPSKALNPDTTCSQALVQDTSIFSKALNKSMRFNVLLPSNYNDLDSCAVLYLLHGYGGDQNSYLQGLSELRKVVDCLKIMVVCVNGEVGWYVNSFVRDSLRYEDYMVKDLIPYINTHYKVGKSSKQRGVVGLSMGGFGSLYLAFKHPDLFAYVGGSSSCIDIKPYPKNWGLKSIFGDAVQNEKYYISNSPYYMIDSVKKDSLKFKLVLDCGTEDFFYKDNERFNEKLNELGIKHDYFTSPGDHNWQYWKVSIYAHLKLFAETVKK